jgi:hypothetical protein
VYGVRQAPGDGGGALDWTIVTGCWRVPDRSPSKAARVVSALALSLALAIRSMESLCGLLDYATELMRASCRIEHHKRSPTPTTESSVSARSLNRLWGTRTLPWAPAHACRGAEPPLQAEVRRRARMSGDGAPSYRRRYGGSGPPRADSLRQGRWNEAQADLRPPWMREAGCGSGPPAADLAALNAPAGKLAAGAPGSCAHGRASKRSTPTSMIAFMCVRMGLRGIADTTGSRNSNRIHELRNGFVGREDHLYRARARCTLRGPITTRADHQMIRPQRDKAIVQRGFSGNSARTLVVGCQTGRQIRLHPPILLVSRPRPRCRSMRRGGLRGATEVGRFF